MSQTLSQKRSTFALLEIRDLSAKASNLADFAKLAQSLPAMVLQNGFAQALAFLLSKGTDDKGRNIKENDRHIQAFDIIVKWLSESGIVQTTNRGEAVRAISGQLSQANYLHAQQEALAVLEWVKRYANAGLFNEKKGAS